METDQGGFHAADPAQRCVIVGVDGSPNSIDALRRAAEEARRRNARLTRTQLPGRRRK
jgi:hypothetical protein